MGVLAVVGVRGEAPTPVAALPPAPIVSYDGALVIGAATETADLRLPVLTFAGTVRSELAAATGLTFGSRRRPVSLTLGRAHGERGASLTRVRDAAGVLREQVDVPDPDAVDLDELRFVLVRAFLRTWLADAAGTVPPTEPPLWFVRGLARRQSRDQRLLDFEQTYRLWSRGRLPLLSTLLEPDSLALDEPAVASVLTGFISGEDAPEQRFRTLLEPLAAGEAWRAEAVLALVVPSGDVVACERVWDVAMLATARTVIVPGVTSPGVLRRFYAQLRLYPADVAAPVGDGWRGRTPAALLAVAEQPWARRLAVLKRRQMEGAAIGRDATLMRVAQDYALFFHAMTAGVDPQRAVALLHAAQERLRDAAQQAATGKMLVVPPLE